MDLGCNLLHARREAIQACWLVGACLCVSTAQAQALWTGKWFSIPEASRRWARSFMLTALPDGGLRYDNGGDVLILAPGGKPTPQPFQPELSVLTRELTPTSFRYEKMVRARSSSGWRSGSAPMESS